MKTIKLFFIIGTLITSFSLISQEDRGKENNLITQFLSDKGATPDEKINVQCELALLEEQYKKEDKTNELISAFETVLNSFRQRSEEHTSELQSRPHLVCRLLLEKKKRDYTRF